MGLGQKKVKGTDYEKKGEMVERKDCRAVNRVKNGRANKLACKQTAIRGSKKFGEDSDSRGAKEQR